MTRSSLLPETLSSRCRKQWEGLNLERQALEDQLSQLARREDELIELEDRSNHCPCGESHCVLHEDHLTGWCEECGRCYVYAEECGELYWLDPQVDVLAAFSMDLPAKQERALREIWNNEGWIERKYAAGSQWITVNYSLDGGGFAAEVVASVENAVTLCQMHFHVDGALLDIDGLWFETLAADEKVTAVNVWRRGPSGVDVFKDCIRLDMPTELAERWWDCPTSLTSR